MPDINSITVLFANGVKREEYGPVKRAEVTITAAVADGEDGGLVLDLLSQQAMAKVAFMLDAPKPATLATRPAQAAEDVAPPKRRGRPPKDQFSGQVAQSASETEGTSAPAAPAPVETSAAGEEWEASAPVVTDQELLQATSAKAQALGNREPVKDLISTFNPGGPGTVFKVQDIPNEQRRDYLDKLAALT